MLDFQIICQGGTMASSLTKLRELGFKPDEDDLFDSALKVIQEKGHTHVTITHTFVVELASLVEVRKSGEPASSSSLSVSQFSEILLFMISRTRGFSSSKEASYLKRRLYDKHHFALLARGVEEGKVQGEEVWSRVTALITAGKVKVAGSGGQVEESGGAGNNTGQKEEEGEQEEKVPVAAGDPQEEGGEEDEPEAEKDCSGATLEEAVGQDRRKRGLEEDGREEDKGEILVKCQALLASCGLLLGSSGEVAASLETWQGEEGITTGLVAGLMMSYTRIAMPLTRMVVRILGMNVDRIPESVQDWLRFRYKRTVLEVTEDNLTQPWMYLEQLRTSRLLEKAGLSEESYYDKVVGALARRKVEGERRCQTCHQLGDLLWCGGCWTSFYCDQKCLDQDWEQGHREACHLLAASTLQGSVLSCPGVVQKERQERLRANKELGRVRRFRQQIVELSSSVKEMEEEKEVAEEDVIFLSTELQELQDKVSKLEKSRAGLKSALVKIKRSKEGDVTDITSGSSVKVIRMTPQPAQYLDLYRGEEGTAQGRVYGSSTYIRLNDARQPALNTAVQDQTVRSRAHQLYEVMKVMSRLQDLGREEQEEQVTRLLGTMVRLYMPVFKTVLIKTPGVFNHLMRMDISTSSEMMHSINLTVSQRGKLNIMFEKIYNFRPLCPEAKQRVYDRELADVITRWVEGRSGQMWLVV